MRATRWRRFRVVLAATLPLAAITVGSSGQSPAAPPRDPIPYETNGPKPGSKLWGYADASGRLIPRQNIYIVARGYVNHQGREFFEAPGLY